MFCLVSCNMTRGQPEFGRIPTVSLVKYWKGRVVTRPSLSKRRNLLSGRAAAQKTTRTLRDSAGLICGWLTKLGAWKLETSLSPLFCRSRFSFHSAKVVWNARSQAIAFHSAS